MGAQRVTDAGRRVDAVLAELRAASEGLARLAEQPDRDAGGDELSVARAALLRACDTIGSQDDALRELVQTIDVMGRQLVDSHARFEEWMTRPGGAGSPR